MSGTKPFTADQVQLFAGTAASDLAGTMLVLMKTNRYYTDGTLKQAKTSYTVTREWGRMAVEKGWAEDTGDVLPLQDSPGFGEGNVVDLQLLVTPTSILTDGLVSTRLADAGHLADFVFFASTQSAVSTTAVVPLTPTGLAVACRLAWVDLKPPKSATTDATGYAVGTKTITLAAAGTGAFYAGDVVTFAGQTNEYTLLSGDSDVSNGGSITLAGYGLYVLIAASTTAITLVKRGAMLRLALNCDNDVEGLLASQTPSSQDASVRLGETCMLRSDVPITLIHASANVSVLANNHRIDATFGI